MVPPRGFEPRYPDSNSGVLPLDEGGSAYETRILPTQGRQTRWVQTGTGGTIQAHSYRTFCRSFGAPGTTRTCTPQIRILMLCPLSYGGLAGTAGLEPATSRGRSSMLYPFELRADDGGGNAQRRGARGSVRRSALLSPPSAKAGADVEHGREHDVLRAERQCRNEKTRRGGCPAGFQSVRQVTRIPPCSGDPASG